MNVTPQDPIHDVLVVGGGPVGMTMALALGRFLPGVRLGLLDRRPLSVPQDSRASAVAAGVRHLFQTLGVWEDMAPDANPIKQMRITDSAKGDIARPLFLTFEGPEAPGEPFAHMVPNTANVRALIAGTQGAFEILPPGAVSAFAAGPASTTLELEDGRALKARLVIAADGGKSTLRGLAGISVFSHDYRQSGIVTTIAHSVGHEDVAYEHFRPSGPFASLPLKGDRSSLVWTETPETAKAMLAMDTDDIARAIESAMGSTLGRVSIVENVQSFPLGLALAHAMIGPRLALVGDAAHVIHPIAGQGLNLGMRDVAVLAEIIVDAARLGEDIGSPAVLGRYQSRRRVDTGSMALVTDGLNRLFSNDVEPVRAMRDFGLSLVQRMEPLKDMFIAQAAGTAGAKLLKGLPL